MNQTPVAVADEPKQETMLMPPAVPLWQAIDTAMKAITVAMATCQMANLPDLVSVLGDLHEMARERRDRA